MTIADFLYQASFWQWVGMFIIIAIIAEARPFNWTIKREQKSDNETKDKS
mgnify:FL=1